MSESYAILAARCGTAEMTAALLAVLDEYTLLEQQEGLADFAAMYAWASPRCGYLTGQHPEDAKAVYADGQWAAVLDFSMLLEDDDERLAALSAKLGHVAAVCTQGTAGFASLAVFDSGELVYRVTGLDGDVTVYGDAPLEGSAAPEQFGADEAEALWKTLGLSSFRERDPAGPFVGLHLKDETDHGVVDKAAGARRKKWWEFWK